MKKGTTSYAMHMALALWQRPEKTKSTSEAIAQHAHAHQLSASGLYKALLNAGLIERTREQRKA